ncbi:MAG TPA: N-acetylmuramoyl-L-alanine amidase [Clostridiaceae bacterium]|nr:N-acetylmuramoyl-L-alanine amidase [Clostridiaceae bacterium]
MENVDIILDAGHGGNDPGAIGPTGLKEKDVNLKIALNVGKMLADRGLKISYTRTTDILLGNTVAEDLAARVQLANNLKAKYFVSIHNNSFNNNEAKGTETYVYTKGSEAEILAKSVQRNLVQITGLNDRGIKVANFYVLKYTVMPAILVEAAFISNPEEEQLLKDDIFIQKAATGIAKGIMEYLDKNWIDVPVNNVPDEWAKEAWNWGIEKGITDGSNPKAYATRQEVITMLYRSRNLLR